MESFTGGLCLGHLIASADRIRLAVCSLLRWIGTAHRIKAAILENHGSDDRVFLRGHVTVALTGPVGAASNEAPSVATTQ